MHREDQLRISDDQCSMMRQEQSHKASGPKSDLSHCVLEGSVCVRQCVCELIIGTNPDEGMQV